MLERILLCGFLFNIYGLVWGLTDPLDALPQFPPPIYLTYPEDYCLNYDKTEEFDFVVVGGGTAGLVVARRLAENECWNVLVLEAGSDPVPSLDIPGFIAIPQPPIEAATTWPYVNMPSETACRGMKNGQCNFRQTKAIGGCSQLNFMIYSRGNKADYDHWEGVGNPGWNYEECLPFFKKSEKFLPFAVTENRSELTVSSRYHSNEGLLQINNFPQDPATFPLRNALIESFNTLGVQPELDINGENQIGITNAQGFLGPQHYRMSSARAFLLDKPDNLKICKFAEVDKILIDKGTATGVSFALRGGLFKKRVKASKEVIISAGSFNSPLILERSGLGQRKLLRDLRIPLKKSLPGVGENLHDHFVLLGDGWSVDLHSLGGINMQSTALTSLTAFVDLEHGSSVPDIQYLFFAMPSINEGQTAPFVKLLNYDDHLTNHFSDAAIKRDLVIVAPALLRPVTQGDCHSTSKDHRVPPKINIRVFSDKGEVDRMVRAAAFSRKVMEQQPMKRFKPEKIVIDRCYKKAQSSSSYEYQECMAHTLASSLYHPTGTCKMGPGRDKMAVVNNKLRVHGIGHLRVIDASIMPNITRGNTDAPTVMIAERGATFIRNHWINKGKCHEKSNLISKLLSKLENEE